MQKSFSTQSNRFFSTADLDHPILHSLDDTEALLEWSEIETLLTSTYDSNTGRPRYPLLTLFRSLLLGVWYQLSDVQLAQCLYRDLLFRKFCRLELGGDVPEASTIGQFRTQLVEHDLWDRLLGEINRQLEVKNIIMKEGRINIIDKVNGATREGALGHATPIEAAQSGAGNGKDGTPSTKPLRSLERVVSGLLLRIRDIMGLGKNATVYGLAAMAANIRKGAKFLTLYGILEPSYAG